MATHSAEHAVHPTLSSTTVDTCTLTHDYPGVEIDNDGSTRIWFTWGSTSDPPADPEARADDSDFVEPGSFRVKRVRTEQNDRIVVKVVGSGNQYSVIGTDGVPA